jgi:hypothetical protein
MSDQIVTAYQKGFNSSIYRLLQQEDSKFSMCVRKENQHSEEEYFDQIGKIDSEEVNVRFADSPVMNTPHYKRKVTLSKYHLGDFFDSFDEMQTSIDPTSDYIQNFRAAANRDRDDIIIASMFGTAYTGKAGTTATTYPTSASYVVPVNLGGSNVSLTVAKLRRARKLLTAFEVDFEREEVYISVSAEEVDNLLSETQVASSDYNAIKPLVDGQISKFMGFTFVPSQRLLLDGSGHRRIPVWCKSAILHTVGMDFTTRISERSDKSFNWYGYARWAFGAVRMEEEKVIEIKCLVS